MQRLLIADGSKAFAKTLERQLKAEFELCACFDSTQVVETICGFEPDIMLLDLALDGLSVIKMLRASGREAKVVVTANIISNYIAAELERLDVSHVFRKPCKLGAVICALRDLSMDIPAGKWCVENTVDETLLHLGFNMGRDRYRCVYNGILVKYNDPAASATKELYPTVARQCGGNPKQVEKAIRDAIKSAWKNGDEDYWKLFFFPGKDGILNCPTNEEFLAGIANYLQRRTRIKKPYRLPQLKAE